MDIECWANWVTVIGFPVAIITVYFLYVQIKQTRDIEESKVWLELRNMFYNNHRHLTFMIIEEHLKVENKDCKFVLKYKDSTDKSIKKLIPEQYIENELDLYLGQFEMTYNLVKKGFLNKDIFMIQYKYRIDYLFDNPKYKEFLQNKLENEAIYWKSLKLLIEECKNYKFDKEIK